MTKKGIFVRTLNNLMTHDGGVKKGALFVIPPSLKDSKKKMLQ